MIRLTCLIAAIVLVSDKDASGHAVLVPEQNWDTYGDVHV